LKYAAVDLDYVQKPASFLYSVYAHAEGRQVRACSAHAKSVEKRR
jgi:hypothetical protein